MAQHTEGMADDIVNTAATDAMPYDAERAKDPDGADAPEMAEVKELRFVRNTT